MKKPFTFYRIAFYILGCIFLALGITLSTRTGLGVSPIISMPFAISYIWGLNFAVMTFVVYSILVGIEFLLKQPNYNLADLLQIPFSLVFSILLDFFGSIFTMSYTRLWQNLCLLIIAIIFTGIGAAMMVNMRLIPNPADGLAHTIGEVSGKGMGLGKNIMDFSSVGISCLIGLIFAHQLTGIGIGTVIAMIGVGRVIAVFNHFFKNRLTVYAFLSISK